MKILFVSRESGSDFRYGMAKSTLPLIQQLQRKGHQTHYLCPDELAEQYKSRFIFKLLDVLNKSDRDSWIWQAVKQRLEMGAFAAHFAAEHNFSHVHCQDPIIAAAYYFSSLFKRQRKKIAWGFSEHGFGAYVKDRTSIVIPPRLKFLLHFLEKKTAIAAHWVITPSRCGRQQLAEDLDIPSPPKTWHAVYHARPNIRHYRRDIARQKLGWSENLFYIVGVGQLIELKQFPILIKACARLKNNAKIQVVILGEGDSTLLQQTAKEYGLFNAPIITVTDDIGLYLCASDLYVSTSATESFGIANLEAAVAGLPVVCSAVDAVPEIMGSCAILLEANEKNVAAAIQQLLDSPHRLQVLASACEKLGRYWPDSSIIAEKYEHIFLSDPTSTSFTPVR